MSINDSDQVAYHAQTPLMDGADDDAAGEKKRKTVATVLLVVLIVTLAITTYVFMTSETRTCDEPGGCDYVREDQIPFTFYKLPQEYYDGTATGVRALCNDESEPSVLFKEANKEADNKNYVIYIPGGAGCWDESSCSARWDIRPDDMTAYPEDEDKIGRGITNSDTNVGLNPFRNWNMAWFDYCSSDGFIGRVELEDNVAAPGWHFGGDAIFWGSFQTLLNDHGLTEAENIIVTSSSAGAEGTMQQMDRLRDFLEVECPNARVRFAFDNGWHVDGIEVSFENDEEETRQLMMNWNPHLNEACLDAVAAAGEEDYKCFYSGTWLYPSLKHKDFFLHMHLYDFMQHSAYGVLPGPWTEWTDEQREASDIIAAALAESFEDTDAEITSYSGPSCREHDDFDKEGWVFEAMPEDFENQDPETDYNLVVAQQIWNFMMGVYDDVPFRVYDLCMEPYCNPTCATLPYDDPENTFV
jgi:hypothetical protein